MAATAGRHPVSGEWIKDLHKAGYQEGYAESGHDMTNIEGLNVHELDAKEREFKSYIRLISAQRRLVQSSCKHFWGRVEWTPPGCHEDPPKGDWHRSCGMCKVLKFVNQDGSDKR